MIFFILLTIFLPITAHADVLSDREINLFSQIRCLVCQGESLKDSSADMAVMMKDLIHNKIAQGQSDTQIIDFLRDRYGDTILMSPPMSEYSLVLWLLPLILMIIGMIWLRQRK